MLLPLVYSSWSPLVFNRNSGSAIRHVKEEA